jgi:hypothetical protein
MYRRPNYINFSVTQRDGPNQKIKFPHCKVTIMYIAHKMCVLIFYEIFDRKISHSEKNSARYCHKENLPSCTGYCCNNVVKLGFLSTDFRKKSNSHEI